MILGTTFIRQFTGSFNTESRSIALAPSITSEAGSSIEPIGPPTPPSPGPNPPDGGGGSNVPLWEIFLLAGAGFLLLILIIAMIIYCITKQRKNDQDKHIDDMREQLGLGRSPKVTVNRTSEMSSA